MKSYTTKFKSFLWKIVQMGTLQKLQNSIQTLIIFWPVYPVHTNYLFWVIFVELPFCHFSPPNTSNRGEDSKIQLIFHLNILVFQLNGKQPYSFPVLSHFCNGLLNAMVRYSLINESFFFAFSTCIMFCILYDRMLIHLPLFGVLVATVCIFQCQPHVQRGSNCS